jgi:hypothetical protein
MIQGPAASLSAMYEADETAWLDAMVDLIANGRLNELDYPHLREFLADSAARDRREVEFSLARFLTHVLRWERQPEEHSRSWRGTILEQQDEPGAPDTGWSLAGPRRGVAGRCLRKCGQARSRAHGLGA